MNIYIKSFILALLYSGCTTNKIRGTYSKNNEYVDDYYVIKKDSFKYHFATDILKYNGEGSVRQFDDSIYFYFSDWKEIENILPLRVEEHKNPDKSIRIKVLNINKTFDTLPDFGWIKINDANTFIALDSLGQLIIPMQPVYSIQYIGLITYNSYTPVDSMNNEFVIFNRIFPLRLYIQASLKRSVVGMKIEKKEIIHLKERYSKTAKKK